MDTIDSVDFEKLYSDLLDHLDPGVFRWEVDTKVMCSLISNCLGSSSFSYDCLLVLEETKLVKRITIEGMIKWSLVS